MSIDYIYPTGNARQDDLAARPSADELGLLKGDGSFSFGDLLDALNPLHYVPGVNSLYHQADAGSGISSGIRLASGFFLGGPVGFIVAAANAGLEAATGSDAGGHLFAFLRNNESERRYAANAYQNASRLG